MERKPEGQTKTGEFATTDSGSTDRINDAAKMKSLLADKNTNRITLESFLAQLNVRVTAEKVIEAIEVCLTGQYAKSKLAAAELWLQLNQLQGPKTVEQHFYLPTHVGIVNLGGVAQMIGQLPPSKETLNVTVPAPTPNLALVSGVSSPTEEGETEIGQTGEA